MKKSMDDFLNFLDFYNAYKSLPDQTPTEIGRMCGFDDEMIVEYYTLAQLIDNIINTIREYPQADVAAIADHAQVDIEDMLSYVILISIIRDDVVSVRHFANTKIAEELFLQKKQIAIRFLSDANMSAHDIADRFGVNVAEIEVAQKNLPVLREQNALVKQYELENRIRTHFSIHPYSTVKESAKVLGLKPQELLSILEEMRMNGENIRFNNVPARLEKEEIRHRVIELKTQEPAITNAEISIRLGIPVSEAKKAVSNTIKVLQTERADAYFFLLNKTSDELETIKSEALKRHSAGNGTSSRWLEIMLIAIEKQIAIHGLKAPERLDVRQEIRVSKQERDKIIDAAVASDAVDIDFSKIQVTGG